MKLVAYVLAAAVSFVSASAAAQVIYSSLGPGDSFSNDGAASVAGADSVPGGYQSMANMFTVSGGDCQLGKIEVALFINSGANSIVVSLAADNGGIPGIAIESFSISGLMSPYPGSILSVSSSTHPSLSDGLSYWVVLEAGAADTAAGWCDSLPHVDGTAAWDGGAGWKTTSNGVQAFRVNAVPEPATVSFLVLAGAAAILRRRRP